MDKLIVNTQREVYSAQYRKFGDTPEGVFWNNLETQNLRFARIKKAIVDVIGNGEKPSIHDVGCGTCALYEYLNETSFDHNYSGTEIVPEMVANSSKKFPSLKLYQRDLLEEDVTDSYDFTVLSGVLNMKAGIADDQWASFVEKLLSQMFKMSKKGIVFNFLTSHITVAANPDLHYINPSQFLEYCHKHLSRFVVLDQAYPLFEVTMAVYQPAFMAKVFDNQAFRKYF